MNLKNLLIILAVGGFVWWFLAAYNPAPVESVPDETADIIERENVEEYLRANISRISPISAVLGGTWYVLSVVIDSEKNSGTVEYEDGHILENRHFSYTLDALGSVSSLVIGLPVAENPEGEADPKRMKLDMTEWRWVSALYNDGKELKPRTFGDFTLTFKNDGTFGAKTDCNSMGGKYKVQGNLITFSEMMSTLMYCEGSQEGDFAKILEHTASYLFTNRGELILEFKFDSGTATFR